MQENYFAIMQRLGIALMLPIAVLPVAGLLLRPGQPDVFNSLLAPGLRLLRVKFANWSVNKDILL